MSQANRRYVQLELSNRIGSLSVQWNYFRRAHWEQSCVRERENSASTFVRTFDKANNHRHFIFKHPQLSRSCPVTLVSNYHHLALSDLLRGRREKSIKYARSNTVKIFPNSDQIPSLHSDLTRMFSEDQRKLTDDIV
jgi:hypothetical protein